MATEQRRDTFAIVVVILVVLAAAMLFYYENPLLPFSSGQAKATAASTVSLYVLPHDKNAGETQENSGAVT